ncbi:hypothetical protein DL96DRAFT_1704958 [Flagelloscypha sp. PMI_526]|nr:hypothetical protein DL96DRAFT_1704958 [Flagelloscypha sp. PMI_526]
MRFLSFMILGSLAALAAAGGDGPKPSQTPSNPGGYDCPDKDASGHACTGRQELKNGHFKCFYDWSHNGGKSNDNHCEYDNKGNCGNDHNYNQCKVQAKKLRAKRDPAPPTTGPVARAPRALKQLKLKRSDKSRMDDAL